MTVAVKFFHLLLVGCRIGCCHSYKRVLCSEDTDSEYSERVKFKTRPDFEVESGSSQPTCKSSILDGQASNSLSSNVKACLDKVTFLLNVRIGTANFSKANNKNS